MAAHRPLVIVGGQIQQLPVGDSVTCELPPASDAPPPDLFMVHQSGWCVGATLAQMRVWLGGTPFTGSIWDVGASVWDSGSSVWDI